MTQVGISGRRYLSHSKGEPERRQCGHLGGGHPRAREQVKCRVETHCRDTWRYGALDAFIRIEL